MNSQQLILTVLIIFVFNNAIAEERQIKGESQIESVTTWEEEPIVYINFENGESCYDVVTQDSWINFNDPKLMEIDYLMNHSKPVFYQCVENKFVIGEKILHYKLNKIKYNKANSHGHFAPLGSAKFR